MQFSSGSAQLSPERKVSSKGAAISGAHGPSGAMIRRAKWRWDEEDQTIYTVVVNDEEQYSIWPE